MVKARTVGAEFPIYMSTLYSSSFEVCTASSFVFYQFHSFCMTQSIFRELFFAIYFS